MKKVIKIICFIFLAFLVIILGATIYYTATTTATLDLDKIVNTEDLINLYDVNGQVFSTDSNNYEVTKIEKLNDYTINAFIAIEDKRFFKHNGVDYRGLLRATLNNIAHFSFKEGASTITQQLIKNTHLTNDKTIRRKISEIKLAKQLEKKLSKYEILEKYLNTIYFGNNCYGITKACAFYFDKKPSEIDVNESAMLSAIIKAPSKYAPNVNLSKCNARKNLVLKEMFEQGYISKDCYEKNLNNNINDNVYSQNNIYDYKYLVKSELNKNNNGFPYYQKSEIQTYYTPRIQKIVNDVIKEIPTDYNTSVIVLDNYSNVLSYYSTCGNVKRQIGSIIKPILVYAPAIEENTYMSASIIDDEKMDFNGYNPSNYGNVYRGKISVKDALKTSSNVCAVKIFNQTGINNSVKYLLKTDIKINEDDKNLSLALGASKYGAKLTDLASAYSVFLNNGNFYSASCIKKQKNSNKIFSDSTSFIVNDMLKETVNSGTAKKLSYLNFQVYAKTGTVGSANGNSDAYCISFTKDYIVAVWVGNKDGNLINVTGGTLPALISKKVWENIYNLDKPNDFTKPNSVKEVFIDKISYDEDGIIEYADNLSPLRYKEKIFIKDTNKIIRTSSRFSKPLNEKPKIEVNNNKIYIRLCLTQNVGYDIYKAYNGKKEFIRSIDNGDVFIDDNIIPNTIYEYTIIPYTILSNEKYYGDEIILDKIKSPNYEFGDDWLT